ncbi:MAG: GntR family transcriptional regulator [Rubrivivax sp.]
MSPPRAAASAPPLPLPLPLPKYHQIYLVLLEQLRDGRFAAGLPGEVALADQFGVARVTVRKALEQLTRDGLIQRARGRGTVPTVAPGRPPPTSATPNGFTGLLENIVSLGLATTVRVVSCETVHADAGVASSLYLAPGAPVHKAVRVRSTRAGPLSFITTHVPADLAGGLNRRTLARKPLLILLEASGVRIGRAVQTMSACLADATVAPHLDVPVGSALLAVRRLIHDQAGRPVQRLHGLYRPDRYQYEMKLSRVGEIDAKVWVSDELTASFH